ncbi:MAG: hypothetical protein NT039_01800, partial [Candidatus Berkelbacteria bacterium]|nr:hypothetical protein [Candidatus Berkelbacteria bacterium]
ILKEEINAIVGARKKWVNSVTEWIREKDRFLSRSKKQLKEIKEEASEGKDVTDKIKEIEGRIEKIENEKDKLSASRFPLDSHSYSRSYPSQDAVFTGQGLLRRCAICGRERVPIDSMSALCDECNMDKRATSGSQYDL